MNNNSFFSLLSHSPLPPPSPPSSPNSLMQTLGHLSVPDKNKDRIVISGVVELLAPILKRNCIDGNQKLTTLAKESAVFVIWQLAFKEHIRPLLLSTDLVDCLKRLGEEMTPRLQKNIEGALFTLDGKGDMGKKKEKKEEEITTSMVVSQVFFLFLSFSFFFQNFPSLFFFLFYSLRPPFTTSLPPKIK